VLLSFVAALCACCVSPALLLNSRPPACLPCQLAKTEPGLKEVQFGRTKVFYRGPQDRLLERTRKSVTRRQGHLVLSACVGHHERTLVRKHMVPARNAAMAAIRARDAGLVAAAQAGVAALASKGRPVNFPSAYIGWLAELASALAKEAALLSALSAVAALDPVAHEEGLTSALAAADALALGDPDRNPDVHGVKRSADCESVAAGVAVVASARALLLTVPARKEAVRALEEGVAAQDEDRINHAYSVRVARALGRAGGRA
jgi:hypothetical protein